MVTVCVCVCVCVCVRESAMQQKAGTVTLLNPVRFQGLLPGMSLTTQMHKRARTHTHTEHLRLNCAFLSAARLLVLG